MAGRRGPREPQRGPSAARRARVRYEKAAKTTEPGEGSRFAAVEAGAKARGAKNPAAVAASIMWKKYGKKGGAALIKKGKA